MKPQLVSVGRNFPVARIVRTTNGENVHTFASVPLMLEALPPKTLAPGDDHLDSVN